MVDPSLLVLASLAEGDKHGYAIMEDVLAFAGIRLGPGTLYGAIARLEEQGSIRPLKSAARRQPYRITTEGKAKLQAEIACWERIVRTGARRLRPS